MGILSPPEEILPLGVVGRFGRFWIQGWDKGRSDTVDELARSHEEWTSSLLIRTIIKCYKDVCPVCSLYIKVINVDKWLVSYKQYIPPHQIFIPYINVPAGAQVEMNLDCHGFFYVGVPIREIEGYPLVHVEDYDYMALHKKSFPVSGVDEMTDEQVEDYFKTDTYSLRHAYIKRLR